MKAKNYQKRSLAQAKLFEVFELYPNMPLAQILSILISPIGEDKHPYNWDDNEFMGKVEKLSFILEEDYKIEYSSYE